MQDDFIYMNRIGSKQRDEACKVYGTFLNHCHCFIMYAAKLVAFALQWL